MGREPRLIDLKYTTLAEVYNLHGPFACSRQVDGRQDFAARTDHGVAPSFGYALKGKLFWPCGNVEFHLHLPGKIRLGQERANGGVQIRGRVGANSRGE